MAYKLLNWDMQRPFTQEQLQDFEEGWTHQKKMREGYYSYARFCDFPANITVLGLETNFKEYCSFKLCFPYPDFR